MLSQQLTANMNDLSGTLVVTAGPAALAELQGLAGELALRDNVTTNGNITILKPEPPPVFED